MKSLLKSMLEEQEICTICVINKKQSYKEHLGIIIKDNFFDLKHNKVNININIGLFGNKKALALLGVVTINNKKYIFNINLLEQNNKKLIDKIKKENTIAIVLYDRNLNCKEYYIKNTFKRLGHIALNNVKYNYNATNNKFIEYKKYIISLYDKFDNNIEKIDNYLSLLI